MPIMQHAKSLSATTGRVLVKEQLVVNATSCYDHMLRFWRLSLPFLHDFSDRLPVSEIQSLIGYLEYFLTKDFKLYKSTFSTNLRRT